MLQPPIYRPRSYQALRSSRRHCPACRHTRPGRCRRRRACQPSSRHSRRSTHFVSTHRPILPSVPTPSFLPMESNASIFSVQPPRLPWSTHWLLRQIPTLPFAPTHQSVPSSPQASDLSVHPLGASCGLPAAERPDTDIARGTDAVDPAIGCGRQRPERPAAEIAEIGPAIEHERRHADIPVAPDAAQILWKYGHCAALRSVAAPK